MARVLRVQYPGAIYHVTLRGNNRRVLFRSDGDRERFVRRLGAYADEAAVRVYLFCLMETHVHLVLETPQANLSAFMHRLQTSYTVYFNLRHKESGHVLDGRYGAKLVEGDGYLLALSRYVHLNPIHVGALAKADLATRMRELEAYPWSSFRSYAGLEKPLPWVDGGPLWAMTGAKKRERCQAYRGYVLGGVAESDEEFRSLMTGSRLGIGGESFLTWVREQHDKLLTKAGKREDVALRRVRGRVGVEEILKVVCEETGDEPAALLERRRGSWLRPLAARALIRFGGLTQREVAGRMGINTGVSVCLMLQRLEAALPGDRALRRHLANVIERLNATAEDTAAQLITKG